MVEVMDNNERRRDDILAILEDKKIVKGKSSQGDCTIQKVDSTWFYISIAKTDEPLLVVFILDKEGTILSSTTQKRKQDEKTFLTFSPLHQEDPPNINLDDVLATFTKHSA